MRIDNVVQPAAVTDAAKTGKADTQSGQEKTFGQMLSEVLNDVNDLQNTAEKASYNLAAGNIQDISEVTVATEKARLALQLTMQVRSKVIDAYQEIMRMQV